MQAKQFERNAQRREWAGSFDSQVRHPQLQQTKLVGGHRKYKECTRKGFKANALHVPDLAETE